MSPKEQEQTNQETYTISFNLGGEFISTSETPLSRTEVAPKKWGYKRYGVDITLTESKKKSMEKKFKKLSKAKYNGFGVQGKNSLVKAFLKYAGNKKSGYYKKKPNKTPEFFCKYGLGYVLGGQLKSGLKNCIAACKSNNDAILIYN